MSKKHRATPPPVGHPTVRSRAKALKLIDELIQRGEQLRGYPVPAEWKKWEMDLRCWIAAIFGENSSLHKEFNRIRYSPFFIVGGSDNRDAFEGAHRSGMVTALAKLESARSTAALVTDFEFEGEQAVVQPPSTSTATLAMPGQSNRVFIVHGRDIGSKEAVARLLTDLGLEPIILHERPGQGSTIIEKIERESGHGTRFAVVIMTADDEGSLRGGAALQPRARQNVIMELGYFIGKLGRDRVCALVGGNVEVPSDFSGVEYVPLEGNWKLILAHELKAAGYEVDLNKLTR